MTLFRNRLHGGCFLATFAAAMFCSTASSAKGPLDAAIEEGRRIFEFEFQAGRGTEPKADGLGPMFNHTSCAGCHKQGGIGGGGPVDVNAEMLSAVVPAPFRAKKGKNHTQLAALRAIHPAFIGEAGELKPNIVLHRFSTDHRYDIRRKQLTGKSVPFNPSADERQQLQRDLAKNPLAATKEPPGIRLLVTHRNTPALFGAGAIDAVSDETLHALAASQRGKITGRVPPIEDRKAGRFGWRGQTERLRDFVFGACANELGLEVPGVSQPVLPQQPDYRAAGFDLTEQQCTQLVMFVAALPAPEVVWPNVPEKLELAQAGEKLFKQVGCAQCHVEDVSPAKGVYSDLLLHDLGPALADPVLAQPAPGQVSTGQSAPLPQGPSRNSGYGGGAVIQSPLARKGHGSNLAISRQLDGLPEDLTQEWRTAPLWGMADSAPYLHDGRAETVLEAIAWHGGEARTSSEQFFALPATERMKVLEFLACLKAP
jgi:CxxC motif-containing protein (DUF1111 family)